MGGVGAFFAIPFPVAAPPSVLWGSRPCEVGGEGGDAGLGEPISSGTSAFHAKQWSCPDYCFSSKAAVRCYYRHPGGFEGFARKLPFMLKDGRPGHSGRGARLFVSGPPMGGGATVVTRSGNPQARPPGSSTAPARARRRTWPPQPSDRPCG